MDRAFKVIFPLTLILGIGLLFFDNTKWVGLSVLAFFQPLILLYYITFFKRSIINENVNYKFKTPFLLFLIITITLIPITVVFRLMHYPFGPLIVLSSYFTGFLTLVFGGIYLVVNRNNLNRILYEFIIMIIPIIALSFNILNISSVKKEDYEKDMHENYYALIHFNQTLKNRKPILEFRNDSLYKKIDEVKETLIVTSGGMNERGIIRGWMDKSRPEIHLKYSRMLDKLIRSDLITDYNKDKLREAKTVMNYLIIFTNIQNELLLSEQKE